MGGLAKATCPPDPPKPSRSRLDSYSDRHSMEPPIITAVSTMFEQFRLWVTCASMIWVLQSMGHIDSGQSIVALTMLAIFHFGEPAINFMYMEIAAPSSSPGERSRKG